MARREKAITPKKRAVRSIAVYARRSKAKDTEGVELQLDRCRARAKREGWVIAAEYVDDGKSGYSVSLLRAGYEAMLADIEAGRVDAVLTYKDDRLFRRDRERLRFFDLCSAARVWLVATADGTDFDLMTADGRKQFREKGSAAEYYSDLLSERLRDHHERLATDGKDSGGERPFGFEKDRVTIRKDEADLVREAARRVIAGESLRSIVADWNGRGLRTAQGGLWRSTRIRRMLSAPRYCGLREHHGRIVAEAVWPAIIDRRTFDLVGSVLADPTRRTTQSTARKHLLPGFLFCGSCGGPLRSHRLRKTMRVYRCMSGPNGEGCGKVSISAVPLENDVIDRIAGVYEIPADDLPDENPSESVLQQMAPLEDRLARLGKMYAAGDLGDVEFVAASKEIRTKLDSLKVGLGHVGRSQLSSEEMLAAASAWDTTIASGSPLDPVSLEQTRRMIGMYIERVTVAPAMRRGGRFDPKRVTITWRKGVRYCPHGVADPTLCPKCARWVISGRQQEGGRLRSAQRKASGNSKTSVSTHAPTTRRT